MPVFTVMERDKPRKVIVSKATVDEVISCAVQKLNVVSLEYKV